MLGYVKIDKGELKVREYEIYTGYYCGICKSIGKRYGQLPRMSLSYDAAFLAILLASLGEDQDMPSQEHCVAHPFIKKKTIIRNRAIDYAGDVMLLLAWHKLADDAKDEGKLYAKATMGLLKGIYRKLQSKYAELCCGLEQQLSRLSALEEGKCESLDMAAEAFSKIMEIIFSEGVKAVYGDCGPKPASVETSTPGSIWQTSGSMQRQETPGSTQKAKQPTDTHELLGHVGYHMGKWIYLIDAVDDIEENIESGAYNPLLYRFKYDVASETAKEFRARIEPDLRFNLYHYLAVLSNYVDSLDIKKNQGIIDNVIYFGLNRKTEEIITRADKDKQI